MSKIVEKTKSGVKQLQSLEGIKRVGVHLMLGFSIGVAVDIILEWFYWIMRPHFPESMGDWRYGVPIGFSIYYRNEAQTIIPWDDVIFYIIGFIALLSKKFWLVIGYFIGGYISSNEGLYGKIAEPFIPKEGT